MFFVFFYLFLAFWVTDFCWVFFVFFFVESVVERFCGSGIGYSDGDKESAQFKNPKSFTADFNGNVYVADRTDRVIRKISRSGGIFFFTA